MVAVSRISIVLNRRNDTPMLKKIKKKERAEVADHANYTPKRKWVLSKMAILAIILTKSSFLYLCVDP